MVLCLLILLSPLSVFFLIKLSNISLDAALFEKVDLVYLVLVKLFKEVNKKGCNDANEMKWKKKSL